MMDRLKIVLKQILCIITVWRSKYFNGVWYRHEYSDLGIYKFFPALHYSLIGFKQDKNPGPDFDSKFYRNYYTDISKLNINPLYHYERAGQYEGRYPLPEMGVIIGNTVRDSLYFNNGWYSRNYCFNNFLDSTLTCVGNMAQINNPGPIFHSKEYLLLNPDVALNNIEPIVHYETYGKYEGRIVALTEINDYVAPENTITVEKEVETRKSYDKKIVTVLAMFSSSAKIEDSSSAKIEDYQLYLLKGLQEISDYIVIVSDNPVYEKELIKLNGLCNAYKFIRHGEYDFGSYKYGYNYLTANNILEEDDNLLFINDSNYGPVHPFTNVIDDFKSKQCDFYGLSVGRNEHHTSIQSFFYIFTNRVYTTSLFQEFISSIKKELTPASVVCNYEFRLTKLLEDNGFKYETYIPKDFMAELFSVIPTKYGYTLISKYKYPLLKRKALHGSTLEPVEDIAFYIKKNNPELYEIIDKRDKFFSYRKEKYIDIPSSYTLLENYKNKMKEIRNRVNEHKKINVVFFAYDKDLFFAENTMKEMLQDDTYNIELYVIPDIRIDEHEAALLYEETFNYLKEKYSFTKLTCDIGTRLRTIHDIEAEQEYKKNNFILTEKVYGEEKFIDGVKYYEEKYFINHRNVIKNCDIVFYPSVYDISYSYYNPFYAVRLNILPVYVTGGLSLYRYDRNFYKMDNYNNFWKVFFQDKISYDEYKQHGYCSGINAVVAGYDKTSYTYDSVEVNNNRKKIVIAPFINLGKEMKLSNLYWLDMFGDIVFSLPKKYKDIDFIYIFSTLFNKKLLNMERNIYTTIEECKNAVSKYENTFICDEKKYQELIAESDGVIVDTSTLYAETVLYNKPCLYMLKDKLNEQKKFNERGYEFYNGVYKAQEASDIYKFIENVVIKRDDILSDTREQIIKNFKLEYTDMPSNIAKYIKEQIINK